jgi:hypothetical protein
MAKPKIEAAEAVDTTRPSTTQVLAPARRDVHLILQGKGGAGKSVIASFLMQYLTDIADSAEVEDGVRTPLCIDTDPINNTFSKYSGQGCEVHHLNITEEDGITIDARLFDNLMEMILQENPPHAAVIDTGSSNFLQLLDYVKKCHIPQELANAGYRLVLHIVIAGGSMLQETVQGFETICQNLSQWAPLNVVVWVNPYHDPVRTEKWVNFKDSATYRDYAANVRTVIELPTLSVSLQKKDVADLMKKRHTFNSAFADERLYTGMCRSRLRHVRDDLYARMDAAFAALG